MRAGFEGPIWPVNPRRETVQGLTAYPSIEEVPEAPDACIVAVAAPSVPEVVEACANKGVKAAVIFSSGFAEAGGEGQAAQVQIEETARRTGIRVLGPNSLGLFNAHTHWLGTFSSPLQQSTPAPGPISIASQSGAVGSQLFAVLRSRGLDTGIWITTGNEADVDLADAVNYFVEDPSTGVIVAYAEGIRDGLAMRAALARAAKARKPVVFMKVGRSRVGAAAVASHTAALAGSDRIYGALFEQYGVLRVGDMEELVDTVYAAVRCPPPAGNRLAILTISGGAGVAMADAAADHGLAVDPPSAGAQARMKALLPFAGVGNPVDTTAQAFNDLGLISQYMRILLEDERFDAVTLFLTSVAGSPEVAKRLIEELTELRARFSRTPIVISLVARHDVKLMYEVAGYPVFGEPTRAVAAIAALVRLAASFARPPDTPLVELPPGARSLRVGSAGEVQALRALENCGVPCVRHRLVTTQEEAVAVARELGGEEVVLKIASPDIKHKTEINGVMVGVKGSDAVRVGFREIVERAAKLRPDAEVEGVLVAEMVRDGVEMVLGTIQDPTFGPTVMVGLGGVFVEVLDDVAFRLAPFGEAEAHRMIAELKGSKLLAGFRGQPPSDVDSLARLLSRMSVLATANEETIRSIDLNPVRVLPKGRGVVVLDALIVSRSQRHSARTPA